MQFMSGRNGPRSKNGCSTCRRRKVKCGEEHPVCARCFNLRLACEWGAPPGRGKSLRSLQPAQPRSSYPNTDVLSPLWHLPVASPSGEPDFVPDGFSFPAVSPPFLLSSTPLYRSLTSTGLSCANSLNLSDQDLTYFQYFPSSSIVHYFMKGWDWSSFCYLYQGPAAANKVIMRMILAISASDIHRYGLAAQSPGRPTAEDHARRHYALAAKEFRQLLESPKGHVSQDELEQVFVTMFLMVIYEWQFGHYLHNLQLHLRGVQSLLESHPGLFQIKDVSNAFLPVEGGWAADESSSAVSFIPEQLLLWTLYVDISCRPVGLTDASLYDYVLESGNPALHPDHLHRCARLWGRCFWGEQYPDQEILDDIENYRGLELLHVGIGLRYKTWKLAQHPADSNIDYTAESLSREIMAVRDRYSDMFLTTKYAVSARRTLITIYFAVSTFYAQILFHRRLLYPDRPPTALHRQAVTNILEIVHKQFNSDPKTLRRLHWPLLMAIIETNDAEQREWLRQRLQELRDSHAEFAWANKVADEVLALQKKSGQYVNLAELLRRYRVP